MVQGEFTLTYALVGLLKEANADVVSACSARQVHEVQMKDGITKKMAEFKFIRFRHY